MRTLRISMAQINPIVGDLGGNRNKIVDYIRRARKLGADMFVFTELAITGYPPEDLLLKPQFVKDNIRTLKQITRATRGITAVVGFVDPNERITDAAAIMHNGRLAHVYHKMLLPNYGVFDEYRYFKPGKRFPVITIKGVNIGINVCEDIWYADGPARIQAAAGAEVIIAINASPYHKGKGRERIVMLTTRAKRNNVVIVYGNTVGGQDELVFDGHSLLIDPKGNLLASGKQFEEDLVTEDIRLPGPSRTGIDIAPVPLEQRSLVDSVVLSTRQGGARPHLPPRRAIKPVPLTEEVYRALVLGTRDYVVKTGFKHVVIGLSGGIDSSLVAAVAVAAIGRDNVHGVFMPSPYSSRESREDAEALAKNLGIPVLTIPIHQPFNAYLNTLRGAFANTKTDVTEENLQARIRGNTLMALSNKFGWLVLTTGNKSETSVGYSTLYGDTAGGFAVLKDVYKTQVYALSRWRNARAPVIPENTITRAPSA